GPVVLPGRGPMREVGGGTREWERSPCASWKISASRLVAGPPRRRPPYDNIDKTDKTRRDSRGCTRSPLRQYRQNRQNSLPEPPWRLKGSLATAPRGGPRWAIAVLDLMARAPWGTRRPARPRARHRQHPHHLRRDENLGLCRPSHQGLHKRQHPMA